MNRRAVFLTTVALGALFTQVWHHHLWGPDEPREAEIARECLMDSHWVTPHLCGLPFLEKPPLYYDLVAGGFALLGTSTPAGGRWISPLLGLVMLASLFVLVRRLGTERRAWLTVLVLLSMPRFYGYTQWILLDIAVGAFSTLALVSFGLCFLKTEAETRPGLLLSCFYLASAGAFLTKGLAGLFHIGVTVLGFCASRGVGTSCASS